ncbi:uncharacterized protein LOC128386307 [Panonychus citri]|uniref:uncharacterized protein LOC128386307 n=1 Tax=Panonychus citri TaxID=50023 RepID=UPI002308265A|nr:uncharacterized protein LOC128386307 [Panonychus citri]
MNLIYSLISLLMIVTNLCKQLRVKLKIKMINKINEFVQRLSTKCEPQDLIVAFEKLKSIERAKFIVNKSTTSKFQRFMCYFIFIFNNIAVSRYLILGLTNDKTLQFILGDHFATFNERTFFNIMIYLANYQGMTMNYFNIHLNNFVDKPFTRILEDYVESITTYKGELYLSNYHNRLVRKWYTYGIRIMIFFTYLIVIYAFITNFLIVVTERKDLRTLYVQLSLLCVFQYFKHFSSFSTNWFLLHWFITILFTYCRLSSFTTVFNNQLESSQGQKTFIFELQKFNNWLDSFNRQISLTTLFIFSYLSFFTVVIVYYGSQHNFVHTGINVLFRVASVASPLIISLFCYFVSFIPRKGKRLHLMIYKLSTFNCKDAQLMLKRLEILDRFSYRKIGLYLNENKLICNHFSIIFLLECIGLYLLMYTNINKRALVSY